MYNDKVIEHFKNPKNFGKIPDADAVGEVGNHRCGDLMALYLKIDKESQVISEVKFETLGCAAAIATSDMIAEMTKGKTIAEAEKIKFQDLVKELGELPSIKVHCADLAVHGIRKAIDNYKKKQTK
ncbi:MAG: iron-sulfur cluster assembly scaffold protein [Candidatus Portnoybacteria bacterium CG10_big_fil_rev_8_21_14_0_10_36_7]|uniref:Iron-sulfur cluster assembly scaffold protein n=1 Tax=Candidatus Portnoybacteria bacterium CG10_big_fil_rev_8_21_14_0_10_36_7 TaxID=1974812 RepID=A0A2M8KE66_9BACT|nr:MAG: iron-sulfur cluster assembly scaffold protein [Candidatus Portnoybacteria bacterium CG10_big_fil_rev_8_21_14_0_10_36_7]